MATPDEILSIVEHILKRVREEGCVPQQWSHTEDGQKVVQFILQVGKYNTAIGQGEGTSIGDVLDKKLLEEVRDLLRSQLSPSQPNIDWQQVSRSLLNEQIQRLTTNPLTYAEGIAYHTEQVYVPLGLVERKRPSRRQGDVRTEQGSLLYEETEITQKFEHEAFLEQVLRGDKILEVADDGLPLLGNQEQGKRRCCSRSPGGCLKILKGRSPFECRWQICRGNLCKFTQWSSGCKQLGNKWDGRKLRFSMMQFNRDKLQPYFRRLRNDEAYPIVL